MFIDHIKKNFTNATEHVALVLENQKITYKDIHDQLEYFLTFLKKHGVSKGSVVAVRGDYSAESIGLMLALIENECIYVPISYEVKDYQSYLRVSSADYLYDFSSSSLEKIETTPKKDLINQLNKKGSPGLILFSSGTTGEPKGSIHDFEPMLAKYLSQGKSFCSIAFLLFDHIGGVNTLLYSLANKGKLVIPASRDSFHICKLIEDHQVEVLPTSPTFINMLIFSKAYQELDLSSLKVVTYGTEPMPQSTLTIFHSLFPNIKLKQTYGLSEVGILKTQSEGPDSLWMKIASDEHHQIKVEEGILWIKSSMSMLGYLNAPSPFSEDGWFNTQDRVEVRDEFYRILGRDSEIINVGGEKVYPTEVESVLLQISEVNDVIVYGEKNPLMGEIVACKVYTESTKDQSDIKKIIKEQSREKLEKFKRPVKIYFSDKPFNSSRMKRVRS